MICAPVETKEDTRYRVLTLDGGGAKGFYTLGVLRELEGMLECRLCERFDLIFGTSTGAIIAALISLGYQVGGKHAVNHVVADRRRPWYGPGRGSGI